MHSSFDSKLESWGSGYVQPNAFRLFGLTSLAPVVALRNVFLESPKSCFSLCEGKQNDAKFHEQLSLRYPPQTALSCCLLYSDYSAMVNGVPEEERKMKTKKGKAANKAKKLAKQTQVRSKSARAHIAEGTRLFALAGRPTKAQFIKVYGPQGPKMTWAQRAKAGVDAKHFQEALKAKGGA